MSAVLSDDPGQSPTELRVREIDPDDIDRTDDPSPDCVLVGERLPETHRDHLSLVEAVRDAHTRIPVVVLFEENYERRVGEALKTGVSDCLPRSLVDEAPHTLRDRVRAHVKQARARTGYRAIYDNVAEPVTLHDPDNGTLVHANRAICDLLGYEREELHSMRVEEFTADLPGYDQARAMETITAATEEGMVGPVEWPLETKGGERRWVESHLTPVRVGGRELILASSTDITGRKRREREYERIFNEVDAAITVHDPVARSMTDVNETMADWTGYDREELLEGGVELFSATDEGFTVERAYDVIEEVVETGEDRIVEWGIETANGERRWLEARATTATIGGEQRVLGISQDVTEAKRREREYEQIFDGVNDSIVVHDPETGEMVDANDTFCELLGYGREMVLELGTAGVSVTEEGFTEERAREVIEEVAETGEVGPIEWKVETADGEHRLLEVTATRAEIGGEPRHVSMMRDITERRRRRRDYERIFDRVAATITLHTPGDPTLRDANRTLCELLGYDPETLVGMDTREITADVEGYDAERIESVHRRAVEEDEPVVVEWPLETADGGTRWIEATVTTARIGGETRVISTGREITEAKRREREYEQIFHGVNDAITVFDPETAEITDVNETYHDMLGYDDLDRIRELGIDGLSATDEGYTGERGTELVRQVAETGDPETVEWRGECADGERIWIEATLAPVEIGGEERVVSMQRDITERKRRQQEFEQIFNGVNDIINVYDPETKELVEVNETMCSLLGYEREEILDRDIGGVSATGLGYTRSRVESVIERVDKEDEPVGEIEWALRGAGGEIVWVEVNATPAVINGERRVLAIARNITGRKDREERVQVLNRVLRHNLRNDMDAVKGYAEMLADDPVEHRQYAERIKQVADDLVELGMKARDIEEILTRTDTGRIEPLRDVIGQSVRNVQSATPEVEVVTDVSDVDTRVDGSILEAVLRELLNNAIEHNDASTPRIEIQAEARGPEGAVELRIADNGPGIPDQELTTLRTGEESDLEHGRGLGLWLIKWGMRRVNGRIEFSSDGSHGTVATLSLYGVTDDSREEESTGGDTV